MTFDWWFELQQSALGGVTREVARLIWEAAYQEGYDDGCAEATREQSSYFGPVNSYGDPM